MLLQLLIQPPRMRTHPLLPERFKRRLHGLTPVCVSIASAEPAELFRRAEAALAESRFLELRLDALAQPGKAVQALEAFCRAHPESGILATCRRLQGGGGYTGSVEEQLSLLADFAKAGAVLVDVELETLEQAGAASLGALARALDAAGASLLVSAHDFNATGDLAGTLARLRSAGAVARPAVYKVVSTAMGLADNLRMLAFLGGASAELPIVGICMGPAGLASRVLALRAGALFTFAASAAGEPTAAGQVSARALLGAYRAAELTAATRVYGVAGNPVMQSLSPALHNAGFQAAALDAVYLPLHTTSTDDLLQFAEGLPLAGLSITMPWKVELLGALLGSGRGEVEAGAAAIGAVNTLTRQANGRLVGSNTDLAAITGPLGARAALHGARVLLLGAGGAARAAAFGLRACGADVAILNRTRAAAEQLARDTGSRVADPAQLGEFELLVQATPAGMVGHAGPALPVDLSALTGVHTVFEMVYRPLETPLTREARRLGMDVIDGLEMFLHQGARQWELWTGQDAPLAAMQRALASALEEQG